MHDAHKALENLVAAVYDYHENYAVYVGMDILQVLAGPINQAQEALCSNGDPGNNAAMREALESVVEYLGGIIPTHREVELVKSARAALSTPPRNCDVGTPEEQARRFDAFCCAHHFQSDKCCSDCPCHSADRCEFEWGQLPYEKRRRRQ